MNQENGTFTLKANLFTELGNNDTKNDAILINLRSEFRIKRQISESIMVWKQNEERDDVFGTVTQYWRLFDIMYETTYIITVSNSANASSVDAEMEEITAQVTRLEMNSELTPIFYDPNAICYYSHEGFVDSLQQADIDNLFNLELLNHRTLPTGAFEITHDDFSKSHKLVQFISNSPRELLISMPRSQLNAVRNALKNVCAKKKTIVEIDESATLSGIQKHTIGNYGVYNDISGSLRTVVNYLIAKNAEHKIETVGIENVRKQFDEMSNKMHEAESARDEAESVRQKKFEDLLAKDSVSKHGKIFDTQADSHNLASWCWFAATVALAIASGFVFWWLFSSVRSGEAELAGILQNVFTKGFLLTLLYLLLNRCMKSYAAEKHLQVVNRHRQNALDTFDAFIDAAGENPETRDAVLLAATKTIFDPNQSGYLSPKARGSDSVNPVQQIIKEVIPGRPDRPDD